MTSTQGTLEPSAAHECAPPGRDPEQAATWSQRRWDCPVCAARWVFAQRMVGRRTRGEWFRLPSDASARGHESGGEVTETVEYRVLAWSYDGETEQSWPPGTRAEAEAMAAGLPQHGWFDIRIERCTRSPWVPVDPAEEG